MGAYYRDTNLHLLLDVLDVNNEESIKNENKQKAIQKFWIAFSHI